MKFKAYLRNIGLERGIARQLGEVHMEVEATLLNVELEGLEGEGQPTTK